MLSSFVWPSSSCTASGCRSSCKSVPASLGASSASRTPNYRDRRPPPIDERCGRTGAAGLDPQGTEAVLRVVKRSAVGETSKYLRTGVRLWRVLHRDMKIARPRASSASAAMRMIMAQMNRKNTNDLGVGAALEFRRVSQRDVKDANPYSLDGRPRSAMSRPSRSPPNGRAQ